ncbi:MAG: Y-family DNA polymerase [Deltaproteobacteria bacterium]|nr:Y-family DNA polymerase [Deltaproteobacteria bacterium]
MDPMFALVDCNNFYASCERVFNPSLEKKPLLVLSSNDGCIIARSNEAKALGIPMGEPVFKWRELIRKHQVQLFSSNFALYGDMSQRVMQCLSQLSSHFEIYSIDEAFLSFEDSLETHLAQAQQIQSRVKQWTGIPVSIGIAPTKTLAKLMNLVAKKNPTYAGILHYDQILNKDAFLESIPVGQIWGVGTQSVALLHRHKILNARQLRDADDLWAREILKLMGHRTILELRGIPCFTSEEMPHSKKGILSSRSFGHPVTELNELKEAVSTYMSRAAEKLRTQGSLASAISVFIRSSRYEEDSKYSASDFCALDHETDSNFILIKTALSLLEKIYKKGYRYKKAGVFLTGLVPKSQKQFSLLESHVKNERDDRLMNLMDQLNHRFGNETLQIAANGLNKSWKPRMSKRSPAYTTSWNQLLQVRT